MADEETKQEEKHELATVDNGALSAESKRILNELIVETDSNKVSDLFYLFNMTQKKKAAIRENKVDELHNLLLDQTIERVMKNPNELSNADLTTLLKTTADLMERNQNQLTQAEEAPLIQINQQNNEVNMGEKSGQSRESRERVKNAVMEFLKQLGQGAGGATSQTQQHDAIDATDDEDGK